MGNRLIDRMPIDYAEPLPNEKHELFCQEYLRLDVEGIVKQAKARRIEAYKVAYPEAKDELYNKINSRASNLLRNENVVARLEYLYEENGSGIENKIRWTRGKAEDELLDIVLGDDKTEIKLKAIDMLNKMRGISAPEEKKEEIVEESSVEKFFSKLRGRKNA